MLLSPSTSTLVDALDVFSQHKLTRKDDLGVLIELAMLSGAKAELHELSFTAKFISRTFGIMRRIGAQDKSYEGLSRQFAEQLWIDALVPQNRKPHEGRQFLARVPVDLRIDGPAVELTNWQVFTLPLDDAMRAGLRFGSPKPHEPAFWRASRK